MNLKEGGYYVICIIYYNYVVNYGFVYKIISFCIKCFLGKVLGHIVGAIIIVILIRAVILEYYPYF
jgi:hypothetical protein